MFVKHISTGLAASALLAGVAFAQTPTATTDRADTAATTSDSSFKGDWRASKLVGLSVYNDKKERIGPINAPATANKPKPKPWYPDHAVFNADKDQLKGMPEFKYSTE